MRKKIIAATASLAIASAPLVVGPLVAAPMAHADACAADKTTYQSCVQNLIKALQAALPECNNAPVCVNGLLAELPPGVTLPSN
jgi:hypothetical protein